MKFRTPPTPADVLWRELEDWFTDGNGTSHPGPDLMFGGLQAADVERLWQFLRSRADPIDPTQTTWDEMDNADVSVVTALERGAVASVDRCPSLSVGLKGVMSDGVKLPWLSVFFLADGVGFFWWVSDKEGWDRDTVAALAQLIDDLRRLAPDANVELQWDSEGEFFAAIDRFLSARAG